MKKSLFVMGMAAMAMASCTNEEVVDIPSSKGIGFGNPYVGTNVRAADAPETDIAALKAAGAGFYVFGGYEGEKTQNVFNNTHVTFSGGVWGYDPMSYWAEGESYKFVAYAPDMGVTPTFAWGTGTQSNDATLTFKNVTVDGKAENQKDFVIGKSNVITAAAQNNPQVAFTLKHALSMIKVTLTNGFRDGVNLNITNFAINGISVTANYTQSAAADGVPGIWTTGAAEETSTFVDPTGGIDMNAHDDVYANEFIVIPQGIADGGVTVTFTGKLTDANGQPIAVPNGTGDGENEKNFTITIPTGSWTANNRYNYQATIDGATFGLNDIKFGDPTVETWGTYGDTDVTIQ